MITRFHFAQHSTKLELLGVSGRIIEKLNRLLNRERINKPNSKSMPSLAQSIKMPGQMLGPGSNLETVHLHACELDTNVAAFVDAPESFGIKWQNLDGTQGQCTHTPDVFVAYAVPTKPDQNWKPGTYREIKSNNYLEKHQRNGNGRYVIDETTGRWRCPAAEKVAAELCGFGYEIVTDRDLNLHLPLARNLDFLSDYLRLAPPRVDGALANGVREYVAEHQGCTLEDLFTEFARLSMDKFCSLVVHGEVYVPLGEFPLTDARQVRIYSDPIVAETHAVMLRTEGNQFKMMRPPVFELGEKLILDSIPYEVVDDAHIDLVKIRDEALGVKLLRRDHALGFHRSGRLHSLGVPSKKDGEINRILSTTPPHILEQALKRLDQISPYIFTSKRRATEGEKRLTAAQRVWLRNARRAQENFGMALVGCISRVHLRGPRKSSLKGDQLEVLEKAIKENYLSPEHGSKTLVYAKYKELCKTVAVKPVCEKTFREHLKKLSRLTVVRAQEGEMNGNAEISPSAGDESLGSQAKFFMHVGRLDELKFDLALLDPNLAVALGTMWVAVLFDGYTRSVLAFSVTFEAPSYHATTLPVLRKCMVRWKRLPCVIVTDRGSGFKADYEEQASNLGFRATWRRSGHGRDGADLERFIGVTQQRIAAPLRGHTSLYAKHRRLSTTHLPETRAVYFPADLTNILESYFFEIYDELPHEGLNGRTPRHVREASLRDHGARMHVNLKLTLELEILMLPKVRESGDALVQAHDGVQAFKLLYWHQDFGLPQFVGQRFQLRWDPVDITKVFVFLGTRWVQADCLKLRHLRGLPPEQLGLISLMIRRDRRLARMKSQERVDTVNAMLRDITKSGVELEQILAMKASTKALVQDMSSIQFDPIPIPESAADSQAELQHGGPPPGFPASYLPLSAPNTLRRSGNE